MGHHNRYRGGNNPTLDLPPCATVVTSAGAAGFGGGATNAGLTGGGGATFFGFSTFTGLGFSGLTAFTGSGFGAGLGFSTLAAFTGSGFGAGFGFSTVTFSALTGLGAGLGRSFLVFGGSSTVVPNSLLSKSSIACRWVDDKRWCDGPYCDTNEAAGRAVARTSTTEDPNFIASL